MKSFAFALLAVAVSAQDSLAPPTIEDINKMIDNAPEGALIATNPFANDDDAATAVDDAEMEKMMKVFGIVSDLVDLFCSDVASMDDSPMMSNMEVNGMESAMMNLQDEM